MCLLWHILVFHSDFFFFRATFWSPKPFRLHRRTGWLWGGAVKQKPREVLWNSIGCTSKCPPALCEGSQSKDRKNSQLCSHYHKAKVLLLKEKKRGGDGAGDDISEIKSACSSFRGSELASQHPCLALKTSCDSSDRGSRLFLGPCRHIGSCAQDFKQMHAHTHKDR